MTARWCASARGGRVERRWPALTPGLSGDGDDTEAIAADGRGAWVVGTAQSAIFRLEGRVVRRQLAIPANSQPIIAHTRDALCVASNADPHSRYHLSRIDPDRGGVTAVVDLGRHRPRALVPVGGGLWVVAGDGTAVLIDT